MVSSGVTHFIAEDDRHAMLLCQKLLSYLPSNNLEDPPRIDDPDERVDPDAGLARRGAGGRQSRATTCAT